MARPTLRDGDIWSAPLANASIRPVVTEEEIPGALDPIEDPHLSSVPGNIKGNFYGWFNRVRASVGVGLEVRISGAPVLLPSGALVDIPDSSVFALANNTVYVFVTSGGLTSVGLHLPLVCLPLARVVASATEITDFDDLRHQVVEQVRPIDQPVIAAAWVAGDLRYTMRATPASGWIFAQGQTLQINDYPSLFAALGVGYQSSPTEFRLPDLRGRTLLAASPAYPLGSIGGAATVTLNQGQMPLHSHNVSDPGHTHTLVDRGHTHGVLDPGHAHGVLDPGHDHSLQYKRSTSTSPNINEGGAELSQAIGDRPLAFTDKVNANVTIRPATANIQVSSAATGTFNGVATSNVGVLAQGGNQPHENMPPYFAVNVEIKT